MIGETYSQDLKILDLEIVKEKFIGGLEAVKEEIESQLDEDIERL